MAAKRVAHFRFPPQPATSEGDKNALGANKRPRNSEDMGRADSTAFGQESAEMVNLPSEEVLKPHIKQRPPYQRQW